ncbi:hypothetical protein [Mycoplasmopsis bovis]|nr:hypothetical protein [Mycoplasmopsis bovis]
MNGATRPIDAGALNTSLGELAATVQKYIKKFPILDTIFLK